MCVVAKELVAQMLAVQKTPAQEPRQIHQANSALKQRQI
jgi:hypothetical protein